MSNNLKTGNFVQINCKPTARTTSYQQVKKAQNFAASLAVKNFKASTRGQHLRKMADNGKHPRKKDYAYWSKRWDKEFEGKGQDEQNKKQEIENWVKTVRFFVLFLSPIFEFQIFFVPFSQHLKKGGGGAFHFMCLLKKFEIDCLDWDPSMVEKWQKLSMGFCLLCRFWFYFHVNRFNSYKQKKKLPNEKQKLNGHTPLQCVAFLDIFMCQMK